MTVEQIAMEEASDEILALLKKLKTKGLPEELVARLLFGFAARSLRLCGYDRDDIVEMLDDLDQFMSSYQRNPS